MIAIGIRFGDGEVAITSFRAMLDERDGTRTNFERVRVRGTGEFSYGALSEVGLREAKLWRVRVREGRVRRPGEFG